ncbi:Hyalin [Holothuria leucospilota]|uniref:Hyalin n=1 Tax=Holothuria leucospilota TaxID=206669 RepID=A0A9Q1H5V8_HOLLE|nr:Hyalin [Holothuria leucospilota]
MAEKKSLNLVTTKSLVISFLLVIPVSSFSTGGGEESCVTLRPNHDVNRPQTSPPPYTLQVSRTTFSPGDIITVTVAPEPNNIGAQTYRGISLQARRTDTSLRAIGSWVIPNSNFQYINCLNSPQGTLTHTTSADKTLPMNFQWASPVDSSGDVIFTATLVQNFDIFWADFRSQIVQDVTVQPELPTITCPMDIRVPRQPGASGSNVAWVAPTCVDATDGQPLVVNCSPTSNSFFITGVTSVTCFCTSPQQAMTTCTFTVTVESPPVIICPSVMQMIAQGNNVGAFVTWNAPSCIDAEEGLLDATCDRNSGSFFLAPQTTVTCTCTDMDGSEATCDFMVDLTNLNTGPSINCPPPVQVSSVAGNFGITVPFTTPTCTDAETLPNFLSVTCNPQSGTLFPIGTNTVICTCTDEGGLMDSCMIRVVVTDVNPPQIVCPPDVTVQSQPNNGGNFASWPSPTCMDLETPSDLTIICDPPSGAFFPNTGVNVVSCNCTDGSGSVSSCTLNVNIQVVNTPPTIMCPQIEGVPSLSGNIGNTVSWPLPSCTDLQDVPTMLSVTCLPQSGDFFVGTGIMQAQCTCIDTGSLSDQCTINVEIVAENIPPTIGNCPQAPVTVESQPNNAGAEVVFSTPTCTDSDQGVMPVVVCDPASGSFLQGIGSRTGTCTCTDLAGDTSQCTFSIIINEANTPPVIVCPPRVIVESLQGNTGNNAVWTDPTCTDTEQVDGSLVVTCNPMTGSFFTGVGDNTVTCTCTDNGGEVDTCAFVVTIEQANTPPTINCPGPVVIAAPMNNNGNVAQMVGVTCTDTGGDDATLTVTCTALSNLIFGNNIVNCECSDSTGLSDTCTFGVTIQAPNTPPRITCPAPVTVSSLANNVGNTVSWADPTCTDVEQDDITLTINCNPMAGSFFSGVQSNSVTCTCTDNGGLSDTCVFTVTVETANTPPVISCPAPVTVTSLANNVGNTASWADPTCTDVEQNDITLTINCNPVSGSFFSGVQSNSVTCTCTDNGGLSDTCVFTVTVETANTPPVITCPAPVTVTSLANNVGNTASWADPTCTDVEQNGITLTINCNPVSGSFFSGVQSNSVTCTCTDNGGLSDTCVFTVTVETANTPPVITCPAPVTVTSLANNVGNTASWADPTCTDVEQNGITLTINCNPVSGSFFSGVQSNSVTCTCTDNGGLSDTCVFTVTVETANTPPVITCPAPVTVTSLANNVGNTASWADPTCTDSEQNDITLAINCNPVSGSFFSGVQSNSVTCTCTDNGGLSDTCVFTVTVETANTPPVITCPAPVTVTSLANNVGNTASWSDPTCTDSEQNDVTLALNCNPVSGSFFSGVQSNSVTCTCTDNGGLSDTCVFTVTVETANAPPVITCPAPVTVDSLENNVGNTASWADPTCTDSEQNDVTLAINCNPVSGSFFSGVQSNSVTCTCTDNGGLSDTCVFTVTVQPPSTAPVITCPAPVTVTSLANNVGNTASWADPTCTDLDQNDITLAINCNPVSGSFFSGVQSNSVTCTCTDNGGLSDTCVFTVTVETANTPPVITCPGPVIVSSLANNVGNTASWADPTCTDLDQNDITLALNCNPVSGSFFSGVQSNSVTCTCTDNGGLSDSCVFTVTVQPANSPPVITCPAPVTVDSLANNVGNTASWADPTCTDLDQNDMTLAINCNPVSGSFFSGVQSNSVTCTCTDNGGLSDSCVFTVTVQPPSTTPVITCPAPVTVTSLANNVGNTAS